MIDTKPPLRSVYLAHYGTKGMKWGQRKAAVSNAIKSRLPERETVKKVRNTALLGSAGVASILYATGTLRPTLSFIGGRSVHGAAWVGSKTLDGAVTAIGTPINIASGGKMLPWMMGLT